MRYSICAVFDAKLAEYAAPFTVPKVGQAVRSFGDECMRVDGNNNLNKHPEDFSLYQLGEYDSESGELFSQAPRILCQAVDFVVRVK